MAKITGLAEAFYVGGYDLSGDIGAIQSCNGKHAVLDVTGLDKSAFERVAGLRDGDMTFNCWFNAASLHSHPVLSTLPTSNRVVLWLMGTSLGSPVAQLNGIQLNYDWNRGQDGSLAGSVQVVGNGSAIEHGVMLTAGKRTDTGAANGTGVDDIPDTAVYGTSTAFGLSAAIEVFSFSGTDVTIKIQDSANNSAFSDVSGAAFTQVTAGPTAERIETSLTATVRRYLRVITSTSGGFSSLVFAVSVNRYLTVRDV